MNAVLDSFLHWLLSASLRASALALAVIVLQCALGRWLPARWRHALWTPIVLVLLAPALPTSRFSVQNSFPAESTAVIALPVAESSKLAIPANAERLSPALSGRSWIFAAWLLGAVGVLVTGGVGYRRALRQIERGRVQNDAATLAAVAELSRELGLRRAPRMVMSTAVASPAVAGLLRPVLLLPADFPAGFSPAVRASFCGTSSLTSSVTICR